MRKINQNTSLKEALVNFLPLTFVDYVFDLINQTSVDFKIVTPRKTKLGDFRIPYGKRKQPQITINNDLNPYAFLITTLHEIAHLEVYENYSRSIKPHGEEWKSTFQKLLIPLLESKEIPEDLKDCLANTIIRTKASSCADMALSRALKKYNPVSKHTLLENIKEGTVFSLNKKRFKKGKLRRTRYLCNELQSGRMFLIHALAEINLIENEG